jgi:hypothetical protein
VAAWLLQVVAERAEPQRAAAAAARPQAQAVQSRVRVAAAPAAAPCDGVARALVRIVRRGRPPSEVE